MEIGFKGEWPKNQSLTDTKTQGKTRVYYRSTEAVRHMQAYSRFQYKTLPTAKEAKTRVETVIIQKPCSGGKHNRNSIWSES